MIINIVVLYPSMSFFQDMLSSRNQGLVPKICAQRSDVSSVKSLTDKLLEKDAEIDRLLKRVREMGR